MVLWSAVSSRFMSCLLEIHTEGTQKRLPTTFVVGFLMYLLTQSRNNDTSYRALELRKHRSPVIHVLILRCLDIALSLLRIYRMLQQLTCVDSLPSNKRWRPFLRWRYSGGLYKFFENRQLNSTVTIMLQHHYPPGQFQASVVQVSMAKDTYRFSAKHF